MLLHRASLSSAFSFKAAIGAFRPVFRADRRFIRGRKIDERKMILSLRLSYARDLTMNTHSVPIYQYNAHVINGKYFLIADRARARYDIFRKFMIDVPNVMPKSRKR